ncbi:MAG: phosphomannose isomerase type II C-terminal cupin domain [Thermoplasmatota archaeon]
MAADFEERPWGRYWVLYDSADMKVKILELDPGMRLSYQRHGRRSEVWIITDGSAEVVIDDEAMKLKEGETIRIGNMQKHRVGNPGDEPLRIVEVQMGDYFGEDDIERFEDDFGRS